MRLTEREDIDLQLDRNGQPVVDNNGNCVICAGLTCWMQDIWLEMQTEEGELLHEDQDGRAAYGYGLTEFLNAEADELFQEELRARILEKLTKRDYIEEGSIEVTSWVQSDGTWAAHIRFRSDDGDDMNIDITSDGTEVRIS